MKKHQLFRNKSYVTIKPNKHLTIVGQVFDSTIITVEPKESDVFSVPIEAITLNDIILVIYEQFVHIYTVDNYIMDAIKEFDHIFTLKDKKIIVNVDKLEICTDEERKVILRKARSRIEKMK